MDLHNQENLPKDRPWLIKAGFDPTSPDLHLGHAVLLRQLRLWQDEGHLVTMIVGDFTASIGDPTGKNKTRPTLSTDVIQTNAQTYMDQALLILDKDKTTVRFNSEWLSKISTQDLLSILSQLTVSQLLQRNDFASRLEKEEPLGLHELLYPILQGLDSVHIQSDLELGGNDQLFNLMMGRKLQGLHHQKEQAIATLPLLLGTDGTQKMSKSLNNHIPLLSSPFEMFSKIMSIPDSSLENLSQCLSFPLKTTDPFEAKKQLGVDIVSWLKGVDLAKDAKAQWEERFSSKSIPNDLTLQELDETLTLPQALVFLGFVQSTTQARQKIKEGAVRLNNVVLTPSDLLVSDCLNNHQSPFVLSLGRRHMIEITPQSKPPKINNK